VEYAQPPSLEARFYRTINGLVEPAVRAGIASPCILSPNGMIVLETVGRRTGRLYRTPVGATLLGDNVIVATYRGRSSQWLKNLDARPAMRYWLRGALHDADAIVLTPGGAPLDRDALPSLLRPIAPALELFVNNFGFGVAVLTPRPGPTSETPA
jgi:deazaflavin-dependent oxidoreductase (nitroreductase family)